MRARRLSVLALVAALLVPLLGGVPAVAIGAGDPPISLASIPNQTLDLYPGLLPTESKTVHLTVDPADAVITVRTTSTDKATVAAGTGELVITPVSAGTLYVNVRASKEGFSSATRTFAVHVRSRTDSGTYDWTGSAKIGGSGYVTGAVFSQIEPNVLYAMTDIGGAYRYDFARDYWIGLNDDATDHSAAFNPTDNRGPGRGATFVVSIVPDPVTPGRVYMAAGGSATNAAIYRSEDYGDHWQRFPQNITMNGNDQTNRSTGARIAIDPKNNNIVYYASQSQGLWKSTNAGQTFIRITAADDLAVDFRPTLVAIDPNSPVDGSGNSLRIIVGTIGATSTTPPTVAVDPRQQRPYKSLWVSQDGGTTFSQLPGQPAARPDRQFGGFVAEHVAFDWTGKLVVAYAEFSLNNFGQVGSNSNFALDGRVYRFNLSAATSENITPQNVYTKEQPDLTATDIANGQVMQRGGIGGISVDAQRPGVMVASSFHRHANYSEEVVWYTADYGATWKVIHSEVVGIKDDRGVGYIDKDKGWGAAVHWAFDIQVNPYDSNMALFSTGNGFWMTKNLKAADDPITAANQVVWGFWDDGLEETVIWNLYSPTQTNDYLYSTYADWGAMSWGKDFTVSPENSLVNTESPANRVKYLDPPFDAAGNPRYDLDGSGNVQKFLKPGFFERWINTENMDYAGLHQDVMVFTPAGNFQNTNISAGVISFDEGKTATPLSVPSAITANSGQGPTAQQVAGWIAISADAHNVVWSVGGQAIANTYWTDVSLGAASAAVGSHVGRPIGASEVRVVAKNGDRAPWTKTNFFSTTGVAVTTGNVKIFSDKVDPSVMYAFTGTTFYLSVDGGHRFDAKTVSGTGVPNATWTTASHGQGANKIQVDPYHTRSIWLANNNATAGLVHLTFDTGAGTWSGTKVNAGTTSSFQQVGIGLGIGNNSVPALYAMGVIVDNSGASPLPQLYGAYRSLDGGATWKRINDAAHQFGDLRALSGDSRVFGRVYVGTGSRGIRVGEVIWTTNAGAADSLDTTTALQSDHNPSVHGQSVTFTATVTPSSLGASAPTGTIQFKLDGDDLGAPVALDGSGQATTSTAALTTAGHSVTAVYSGDDLFDASTSDELSHSVGKAGTSISITNATDLGDHTVVGQPYTVEWSVTVDAPGSGTPTGTVTITGGSGCEAPVADGECDLTSTEASSKTLVATYAGDGDFESSSTDEGSPHEVDKANTTTALASIHNPSVHGQSVTFTATVTASAPGAGGPSGTVQFTLDGDDLGAPVALDGSGQATTSTSALTTASHSITAVYSADGDFNASTSDALSQTVGKADTSTTVDSNHNPSVHGQSVTFTATVSPSSPGAGTPTGSIQFTLDGNSLGSSVALDGSGQATLSTAELTTGSHSVTAVYSADDDFTASTSDTFSQGVDKADTTTALASNHNPSVHGQSVTFTATVAPSSPGAGTPTGSVQFKLDGNDLGSSVALDGSGQATLWTAELTTSSHSITAVYSGDGDFRASTSDGLSQPVGKASTSTTLASSVKPSVHGQAVTFTATVVSTAPGSGIPVGTVQFKVDGVNLGSPVALNGSGSATSAAVSNLSTATHHVTAVYQGGTDFKTSTSSALTQQVKKAETSVSVKTKPNPSTFGNSFKIVATVKTDLPGHGVPVGKVQFYVDGTRRGSAVTLANGKATLVINVAFTRGGHTIVAKFLGSGDYNVSQSSAYRHTIR
jgi:hypothetical protein